MEDCSKEGESKVTNLEYLLKLSRGNEGFVRDMIRIFLDENPSEIKTLEDAISRRDFRCINTAAHKLRSTVPFVGIDKMISDDISEIEKLARDQADGPEKPVSAEKKSFLPTDKELIARIESLFKKVKCICFRACDELRLYESR